MPKLLTLSVIAAASLSPVAWFTLHPDLDFKQTDARTSAAARSEVVLPEHFEMARAANQTTTRILALDQAKRLAFWTRVLRSRKQTCDVVVRASYTGAAESGLDYWSLVCLDGNAYSVSVEPNAQDSFCFGNAFDPSN
jgi:hypothetical protein